MSESTVRWRYTSVYGTVDYAIGVSRYLADQVDGRGRPLIGGGPIGDGPIGPPVEGFQPRYVTVTTGPPDWKKRRITIFSTDAPLWIRSATTVNLRDKNGDLISYQTLPQMQNWRREEIHTKRIFSRGDTVHWRYTTGQGYTYAALIPRSVAEQTDSQGRCLIGGGPASMVVGFPKGLMPRSITVVCPETMKTRQVLIFSPDAPLWLGTTTALQWRERDDRVRTYHVRKRTDEQWPGHAVRKTTAELTAISDTKGEFDSTIEAAFWQTWQNRSKIRLVRQHPVLSYRLDFAHLAARIAIELDGYYYHADPERFRKDRQRDRELFEQGWHVIRFAGAEVLANVEHCVEEAVTLIHAHGVAVENQDPDSPPRGVDNNGPAGPEG